MPTVMTFTSLKEDLRSYLERGNPSDVTVFNQIPRLINLAERSIARALKIEGLTVPAISQLTQGVSVYAKPDRWRDTVSMNYGSGEDQNTRVFVLPRSYEYCRSYWPDSNAQGPPEFYADYGYTHWLVVPTPDDTYPWEVIYYQQPPLLDDDTQTNWLTDYAPNALLYRSLLEATPFLKNDERIATWRTFYDEALSLIDTEDLQKVVDRAAVRNEA